MTVKGAEALRDELNELKSVARPKITAAIAEAREHGDLKENAEYHAAREQQSFCEGRIKEIEGKLADAEIIDVSKIEPSGRVIFGTTVTLYNLETEESVTYRLLVRMRPTWRRVKSRWFRLLLGPSWASMREMRLW